MLPIDWAASGFDWSRVRSCVAGYEIKNATERERLERLEVITASIVAFVQDHRPIAVYIERYAFSRPHQAHQLGELGGVLKVGMMRAGWVPQPMVIQIGRKLLLGKVPRKGQKDACLQAVCSAGAPFETGDEADAFVVANLGVTEHGGSALSFAT